MSNLRIVYDNAADRATISASTTAGSLVASNLQTDVKSEVWRSTSTSATLTVEWPAAELTGVVALPFCNLTSAAMIRVRGYVYADDSEPAFDTGYVMACPSADFKDLSWGEVPLGVNSYSYGGGAYAVVWFPVVSVIKLVIDIDATSNPAGYIEASRLVTGIYWTPTYNPDYGVEVSLVDTSKQERSAAGDLKTDRGTVHKRMTFDMSMLTAQDRDTLWNILRGNGMHTPIYCSLLPESDDYFEEQVLQIYGKMSRAASIRYQFIDQFSSQLEIEEV